MFSYFKKRSFRSHVRVSMFYLLGFDHKLLEYLLKTYPGIWTAIDAKFAERQNATATAIGILTIVFANVIEQGTPVSDRADIEKYILANEGEPEQPIARGIKTFLSQAIVQKDLGAVDEFLYTYMLSEIFGALRGIPANERMANRVVAPLLPADFP
jgi:hypothetical protein